MRGSGPLIKGSLDNQTGRLDCVIDSRVCFVDRGRGSISKVEGHWPKGALLYMTRIKRFYDVHEPNENFLKYGVSITSEKACTESLLLRKGHFLSRKRGRLFKKYFFRSLNGAFKPRKKGTFFTFKKSVGGGHRPPLPPPRFRGPCSLIYVMLYMLILKLVHTHRLV
jgi:hypothetical protein